MNHLPPALNEAVSKLERNGFRGSQKWPVLELRRTLERRERRVAPRALQIGMAVVGARYRGLLRRHSDRRHKHQANSCAFHEAAPFYSTMICAYAQGCSLQM